MEILGDQWKWPGECEDLLALLRRETDELETVYEARAVPDYGS